MKAESRRILTRFLKAFEREFPDDSPLERVPDLSIGQWRSIAMALAVYRATIDEKLLEDDMRRPKISLSEIPREALRQLARGPQVIDVGREGRKSG